MMIMGGLSDDLQSLVDPVKDIVTAWNQQKILEANIERQKLGLAPIDTSAIAPQYNIGLSPDVKALLIFGGIALIAVLLMKRGN